MIEIGKKKKKEGKRKKISRKKRNEFKKEERESKKKDERFGLIRFLCLKAYQPLWVI